MPAEGQTRSLVLSLKQDVVQVIVLPREPPARVRVRLCGWRAPWLHELRIVSPPRQGGLRALRAAGGCQDPELKVDKHLSSLVWAPDLGNKRICFHWCILVKQFRV